MLTSIKNKTPLALIYSRLAIAIVIIILSANHIQHYRTVAIILLSAGLLTDIFDGIIARQLNVSTQKLRRLDSTIDQVFFISFAIATYIQCPGFFKANAIKLIILFSFEIITYLLSFLKFRKEIATHSIGAKIWSLVLVATLIEIIVRCRSVTLFNCCFYIGLITRLEIAAIIITLKTWTNDVPTIYHALKLRKGKAIKKYKIFNG